MRCLSQVLNDDSPSVEEGEDDARVDPDVLVLVLAEETRETKRNGAEDEKRCQEIPGLIVSLSGS